MQVDVQKQAYNAATLMRQQLAASGSGPGVNIFAQDAQFKINGTMRSLSEEACCQITLEIQHPIELVVLQSNVVYEYNAYN